MNKNKQGLSFRVILIFLILITGFKIAGSKDAAKQNSPNNQIHVSDHATNPQTHTRLPEGQRDSISSENTETQTNNTGDSPETINTIVNDTNELRNLSYRYKALSESDKKLYEQIYTAFRSHTEQCTLIGSYTTEDVNRVAAIFNLTDEYALAVENANITTTYNTATGVVARLDITYAYSKNEADRRYEKTMEAVKDLINKTGGLTQYEAELYLHDTLVSQNTYKSGDLQTHSAYGALVNHESVCDGYAKSFKIMCNRIGIPCDIVTGIARTVNSSATELHAWNIITLDGEDYLIDTTYDDTNPLDPDHSFFNMTQAECDIFHSADDDFTFPEANGTKYDYYAINGCVVDSFDSFCEIFDTHLKYSSDGKTPFIQLKAKEPYTIDNIISGENEWNHISAVMNSLSAVTMNTICSSDNTITIYLNVE